MGFRRNKSQPPSTPSTVITSSKIHPPSTPLWSTPANPPGGDGAISRTPTISTSGTGVTNVTAKSALNGISDANANASANTNANAGVNTNASASAGANTNANASANTDANAGANTNANASTSPNTNANVSPNTNEAVGLSNPQMGHIHRRMLDLINGLHSTGVQADIDLPQIAVVGNQSAGKSSLIESISGITLPRASGTCTRCPTECRLSYSTAPWKCVVSLKITTNAQGQPLSQSRNEPFGPVIYDKREVEDRIRRAQLAILNPEKHVSTFLKDGAFDKTAVGGEDGRLLFSMNCISLAISGPGVADLSFVDLPGLIASGNPANIRLVEGLVASYIKKENCIILLTVACETDFENQGAYQLVKRHDPEGKRTIGVLTKPDRIPAGEEFSWLQLIRMEKVPLQHNWFCVKQPSSNDLKQNKWNWQQARAREDEFFTSTSPWNELEPAYARYLRTTNLLERVSRVLSDLIAKRLPGIQKEIEEMVVKTRQQIALLPKPPPENASNEVAKLIKDFDVDMRRHAEGIPRKEGIIQQIRAPCERFRRAIRQTAPDFRPFENHAQNSKKTLAEPDFLKHEEEGPLSDNIDEDEEVTIEGEAIYVDEVYQRIQDSRSRELPGNFPFIVQREYISDIQSKWDGPAMTLCEHVYAILMDLVRDLVHKHFATFGQGMLEHDIRLIMCEHLGDRLEAAKGKIEWLMKVQSNPFTLNHQYLADYKEKFMTYYRQVRQDPRTRDIDLGKVPTSTHNGLLQALASTLGEDRIAEARNALARAGFKQLEKEDLVRFLGKDKMEPALDIMATVRAYFQVAYKRFVDDVPMAIDYELVGGGEHDVFQLLWTRLGLDGPNAFEICNEYAREAPHVAERRQELHRKLERLRQATRRMVHVM